MTMRAVAIYRSASFSPGRHRSNDAAIMDATVNRLLHRGWRIERLGETDVEAGIVPPAELYLNMCQGSNASEALLEIEHRGALMINRPSSVLRCHRHRLVPVLVESGLPFPATVVGPPRTLQHAAGALWGESLWVKRGDVHAQEAADVVRTDRAELAGALAAFGDRGIRQVAIQEHVPGRIVKFYGVGAGQLFHAFFEDGAPLDPASPVHGTLRQLAITAADAVGLGVFGGDAALGDAGGPILIDLNDWPSFAPIRDVAARAIAALAESVATTRSIR